MNIKYPSGKKNRELWKRKKCETEEPLQFYGIE